MVTEWVAMIGRMITPEQFYEWLEQRYSDRLQRLIVKARRIFTCIPQEYEQVEKNLIDKT